MDASHKMQESRLPFSSKIRAGNHAARLSALNITLYNYSFQLIKQFPLPRSLLR